MASAEFDILVLGSGPSGVHAAREATLQGARVALVDVGIEDDRYAALTPDRPFHELRQTDPDQHNYFLGESLEGAVPPDGQIGAQLTPARQFATRDARELLPLETQGFEAVQSLAMGGLGAAWGAGCAVFATDELARIGLSPDEIKDCYERVAGEIGVSGPADEDISEHLADIRNLQAPLEPDSNAEKFLAAYLAKRESMIAGGFRLGRPVTAVLTRPLNGREPNPYHDMDFWSDAGESVWRPRYTLRNLEQHPDFHYLRPILAERFEENDDGTVLLHGLNLKTKKHETFGAKRLLLAAGAINSARLVLRSSGNFDQRVPILSNPYTYLPTINLPMLGRPARDRRHSLVQLNGIFLPGPEPEDRVIAQFYSYRTLLLFRLARDMPLPPSLAMLLSRCIASSLLIVAISHADVASPLRWMRLSKRADGSDCLQIHSERTVGERSKTRRQEWRLLRKLMALKLLPLNLRRLPDGASIHYAGTLPFSDEVRPLGCEAGGRLHGTRSVYLVDGSTWKFLPAKGLTFTLMANARRIAERVTRELKDSGT
jgi:choline dehydrogenase-like flavoprotein